MHSHSRSFSACAAFLSLLLYASWVQAATPAASSPAADADAVRALLAPAMETSLASPFSGRVKDVAATLGSSFRKGKVLVSFDCEEQAARLQMAQAELTSAQETHNAKIRLQGLQQASEVEVALAASAAEKARAQVTLYKAQIGQCTLVAPFSGRVAKVAVKPYQGVTQGQALLEVVSDGPLKLRLNAPSKWLTWLKVGTRFDIDIDEVGKRYAGRVTAINARVDAVSQSVELEGAIDSAPPELLPGMSGTAHFSPPARK